MVTCRRNQHTPAESVIAEAPEAWRNHRARMELIVQQVWVPRQASSTGHRGAHHPSVTDAPAVVALCLGLWRHTKQTCACIPKQCKMQSSSFWMQMGIGPMTDLLPSHLNQSGHVYKHNFLHVLTATISTYEYTFGSSLMSSPAMSHQTIITHTRAWTRRYKHRERDPRTLATALLLLTKATVRPTVATPAVTHFLPSVCDQPTCTVILTRVGAAHWTHEFQTGLQLRSINTVYFHNTYLTTS